LNEVNEYFRIFKDEILKKEKKNQTEIADLKMQINQLKSKLENGNIGHNLHKPSIQIDNVESSRVNLHN
jgi:hypothetical protein